MAETELEHLAEVRMSFPPWKTTCQWLKKRAEVASLRVAACPFPLVCLDFTTFKRLGSGLVEGDRKEEKPGLR